MKYLLLISLVMMNIALFFVAGLVIFKMSKSETFHIRTISTPQHLTYLLDDPEGLSHIHHRDRVISQVPVYGD